MEADSNPGKLNGTNYSEMKRSITSPQKTGPTPLALGIIGLGASMMLAAFLIGVIQSQ